MPLKLRGITDVVITTAKDKAVVDATGVWACAELCFGPGLNDCIAQINLVQTQGKTKQMCWRLPNVAVKQDGQEVFLPVFTGCLFTELSDWASRAWERIRKDIGQPRLGRIYRVNIKTGAEEITNKETAQAATA